MPNNPLDSRLDWDPSQGKDWTAPTSLMDELIQRVVKEGFALVDTGNGAVLSRSDTTVQDRVAEAPVGLADLFEAYNDEHHAYHELACVLVDAYEQAAIGKGKERHANDRAFRDQPIHRTSDLLQSDDGINFQVIKKIEEAKRLPAEAAYKEALGAIVYTSAVAMRYQSRIEAGDAK